MNLDCFLGYNLHHYQRRNLDLTRDKNNQPCCDLCKASGMATNKMQYCYDVDDCIKGGDYILVFCYFRLRKKSKTKKYGVISSRDADLEMRPLEEDDDEEDVTVFEVNGMTDFRSTAHR